MLHKAWRAISQGGVVRVQAAWPLRLDGPAHQPDLGNIVPVTHAMHFLCFLVALAVAPPEVMDEMLLHGCAARLLYMKKREYVSIVLVEGNDMW